MKKSFRKFKKSPAAQRQVRFQRYVLSLSLLVLGAQARAGGTITPAQSFEGGANTYTNWLELSAGGMLTHGSAGQAQKYEQLNNGLFGGIEDFHYEELVAKKTTLSIDGRAIEGNHDYKLGIDLQKDGVGYIKLYFENFRTWDSGNGGFSPTDQIPYSLPGNGLGLDRGKVSLEAAYNAEGKPNVTLKYTHTYRDGQESSTLWGPVHDSSGNLYRLYPGINDIDEASDIFQVDVTHHIKTTQVGLGVTVETGKLNDAYDLTSFPGEAFQQKTTDRQGTTYDMESVHAFTETWFKDKYLLSTGFMFVNLDDTFSGSDIYGDDFDVAYSSSYPANYYGYYNLNGGAHENQYVLNVNLLTMPTKNFTVTPSLRVQQEDYNANSSELVIDPGGQTDPGSFNNSSSRDSLDVCERLDARYTGITNWVYSAGAQWTEGQGSLNENGGITQVAGAPDGQLPVKFRTEDSRFFQKYSLSARWYPIRQANVDVGGYYKDNRYNYDNTYDSTPNNAGEFNSLYPAFLVYEGFQTYDGYTRLTLRPINTVTLVSRYEYQYSTIATTPDPAAGLSEVDSSRMHSHIFGQNASWVPLNWLSLQVGFNYVISTTETPASDYTQAILNSQNNYCTVNFNSEFALDDKTDLNLGYYYYRAADSQNNMVVGAGLPLGTDEQQHSVTATLSRRISKNLRWNIKYAFTHYQDFASEGAYNFNANVIFSSLQYRF